MIARIVYVCALCPRGLQTLHVREYARNDYIPYCISAISTMASVFKQHRFRAGAPLNTRPPFISRATLKRSGAWGRV